jgi:DNA polymerase-3 subunit delta'
MSTNDFSRSHIIISDRLEESFSMLQKELSGHRVVGFIKDDFLVEDAKAVIAEAYISEEKTKYIVLGAKTFNIYSQNALLKVLEEPPRNIAFVIVAPSKSVLLPTVRSRLPIRKTHADHAVTAVDIRLGTLDLGTLFDFVKENERLAKHDAKALIEGLFHQASRVEDLILTPVQLEAFDKAYRLIERNARVQNVLLMLLMHFLPERRNAR